MSEMICFCGYPPYISRIEKAGPEDHVLLRLDQIISVEPLPGARDCACEVEMSTGYRHRIAMKAEDFARNFLRILADFAKASSSPEQIVVPTPKIPQAS